ncbi:dihydropteroate synthase [Leucobacter muris]|uniref:7,8-dihydroneopterin aldolase n=1 Tax=Leucobacter muris TaxID=1935379 RepID=A0ABX5QD84_9MICO|nr:dihydropteroate synthase [Leucobacter muris]QAB17024.1 dihydropteroate synthase [Leucobacter muris]
MSAPTLVMGVLNVTPDSFSDGGRFAAAETAIARGRELFSQGAAIVDIGGESTRPGATPVPVDEEQRRVLPVVRALAAEGLETSIDTIHAETALAAVAAGAGSINDVSGGAHDPAMLDAAALASAEHGARFIIGHWRGIPDPAHQRSDYADVVAEVRDALAVRAEAAIAAGVDRGRIVLDPGLGFDKTGEQCWRLLANLDQLTALGHPVLIGASRKRMIAEALARSGVEADPAARDLATSVVTALAAGSGAWGVRVHDVAGSVQALAVAGAWEAARPGSRPSFRPGFETSPAVDMGSAVDMADPISTAGHIPAGASGPRGGSGDRIVLTGLEVYAHHGVFDFERRQGQRFVIDAEVAVDLRDAAAGDALERTVHYGELAEAIAAAVERDPVDLIETVAERVAAVALGFEGVRSATVTVHKPDAPIAATFADVSVTVVRP